MKKSPPGGKGRSMKSKTFLLMLFVLLFALYAAPATRAQEPGDLQKRISGNWTLVSIYNEWPDGRKLEQFGAQPQGFMILTPDGRFSIFFAKADLPKFAAGNRLEGTIDESLAVARGTLAYFGRYRVENDQEGVVELLVEGCTFPNWNGRKHKRLMSLSGDSLRVVTPASGIGGTSHIVWRRAR